MTVCIIPVHLPSAIVFTSVAPTEDQAAEKNSRKFDFRIMYCSLTFCKPLSSHIVHINSKQNVALTIKEGKIKDIN